MSTTIGDKAGPPERRSLFKTREKVYPKAVSGRFRRLKWAALLVLLGLYYVVPWIRWDRGPGAPDQAVLIDMAGRRAYFFSIEIWPQEVSYLTGLLVLGAVGLFLVTALFGRLWCGYACPQTVWTDLYMWVERLIEGDRAERIRRDRSGPSLGKAGRKLAKHAAWLLIALATGGAWIMYFNDAPTLLRDAARLELSAGVAFFIGLFTLSTYLLAGWAREQVCTYMCPWPRFQAAMLDEHSLVVTYEAWRGEGRGPVRKNEGWDDRRARSGGDCIDCRACVHVSPPASTSGTASSSNASAAACAQTPATTSWGASAGPSASSASTRTRTRSRAPAGRRRATGWCGRARSSTRWSCWSSPA